MTALTAYLNSTASTTLSATAKQLQTTAPAAETSFAGAKQAKTTGYFIVHPVVQNTTGVGSLPTPDGGGFIFEGTTLEGQRIAAGTWTPKIKLSCSAAATGIVHLRAYKRSSGGVYTLIGDFVTGSTSFAAGVAQSLSPATQSLALVDFATGDRLYIDVVIQITAAGGSTTGATTVFFNGGVASSLATPGYAAAPIDFSLGGVSGDELLVQGGPTATDTCPVIGNGAGNQNVTLSSTGLPTGASITFSTNPVVNPTTTGTTVTLTFNPGTGAAGLYLVTVTGTSDAVGTPSHSFQFYVSIAGFYSQPTITANTDPSAVQSVQGNGAAGSYSIALDNCAVGNLLVAYIEQKTTGAFSLPPGWSSGTGTTSGASATSRGRFLFKYADAGTNTLPFTLTAAGSWSLTEFFGLLVNAGSSPFQDLLQAGQATTGSTSNPTSTAQSGTLDSEHVYMLHVCHYVGAATIAPPAGYSNAFAPFSSANGSQCMAVLPSTSQTLPSVSFTGPAAEWEIVSLRMLSAGYPQLVQVASGPDSGAQTTHQLNMPNIDFANKGVILVMAECDAGSITSITDNRSLTWTKYLDVVCTGGGRITAWWAVAGAPVYQATGASITAHCDTSTSINMSAWEWYGLDTTNPIATQTNFSSVTTSTTITGSAVLASNQLMQAIRSIKGGSGNTLASPFLQPAQANIQVASTQDSAVSIHPGTVAGGTATFSETFTTGGTWILSLNALQTSITGAVTATLEVPARVVMQAVNRASTY